MRIGFFKAIRIGMSVVSKVNEAAQDGRISINEAVRILEYLCGELGIDLDKKGFNI